jgi:hypothetical protein
MKPTLQLVAFAGCVASLCAQAPEPPAVIQIIREVIKEGKGAAHSKTEQAEVHAFRKNKYPFHYLALSTISGPNEVLFLEAYPSFAAIEQGYQEAEKAPLKSEFEQAEARDGELRTSSRNMTAVYRKDLSYRPENGVTIPKTRFAMLLTYRVRIGREEDFMAGAKMVLDANQKAKLDSAIITYQVIAGGPEGVYLFLIPMASLKAMDEEPARQKAMMEAMGPDSFRQLMKGAGEVFVSMDSVLYAVSPENELHAKGSRGRGPGVLETEARRCSRREAEREDRTVAIEF